MTRSKVYFGLIPREHWSYPSYINQTKAADTRRRMEEEKVIYGGSESYRHMCRYNSGSVRLLILLQLFLTDPGPDAHDLKLLAVLDPASSFAIRFCYSLIITGESSLESSFTVM